MKIITREDMRRYFKNCIKDPKVTCAICDRPKKYWWQLGYNFIGTCGYHKIGDRIEKWMLYA